MSTSAIRLYSRPTTWKAAAPAATHGTKTFSAELPKLPVANLSDTLIRLKQSLEPIAWSDEEYAAVCKKIDQFAAEQGPELQQRLLSRAEETRHWLEEWWDDDNYFAYRDSVCSQISSDGFDEQPPHLQQTPAARAAGLARAAMIFRQNLKRGLMEPDSTKEGPLCMDTYRWMFDCCRIPGPQGLDWSVSYAKENDTGNSGHIIVFRNNRVWKVEAADGGRILSTAEFEKQIRYIYENSNGTYPGVGVLTASNRDVWAKDYGTLASSAHNAEILTAIQSAAFVISLEAYKPSTSLEHSRALWHGSVTEGVPTGLRTRWVDKPVEFIVYDNVVSGFMGEHSMMDGTPTVRLCDDVLNMLADPAFDHGPPAVLSTRTPTPLDWEISPAIAEAIAKADGAALELIESQELGYLLTPYGKAAIKKFGVSPDSWAQMIVQLAYRRLIGNERRIGGTYEAATTRKFDKGRTEAIRVVTNESDAWVASMDNPEIGTEERKKLLTAATKKHVELAKSAGNGQGIDRLKKVLKEGENIPELFSDPVFLRSSYWVLSTSAIFSKHFPVYGWGEVVPDGFAVAYMTGYDDRLQYTVTSRKEMPNIKFCEEIAKAATDIYELFSGAERSRL
ncbi:Carnitine O-acetyltransferase, mitochondrial [Termitomyces sp. J132]|nr:Carnitine O-acetyltransferase, mitochondrial [Termitomyces sp. J132]